MASFILSTTSYIQGVNAFIFIIINVLPLQRFKMKTLASRNPCWKPESPHTAEEADQQHTIQGTTAKICLFLKLMEQMMSLPTKVIFYFPFSLLHVLITAYPTDSTIWLT